MSEPYNKGKGRAHAWIMAHVDYQGDDCLPWPMSRDRYGYGMFGHLGRHHHAHIFMCDLTRGPRPTPKHECSHSCGNGHEGCTNPKHLSWKTRSENQLDRKRHGTAKTAPFGYGGHVLTPTQREQVRALDGKITRTAIANQFGVSRRTVERTCGRQ